MDDTSRTGRWSVVLGAVSLLALAWTWALSTLPDLNPPNWQRIPGILLLPLGVLGALLTGWLAMRGSGRRAGLTGVALAAVAVLGFGVLLGVAG